MARTILGNIIAGMLRGPSPSKLPLEDLSQIKDPVERFKKMQADSRYWPIAMAGKAGGAGSTPGNVPGSSPGNSPLQPGNGGVTDSAKKMRKNRRTILAGGGSGLLQ